MAYKARFGTKKRDALYSCAKLQAHLAGRGAFPICPHCDLPVTPDQAWDECHIVIPAALGGTSTAVGHRLCNHRDNHTNVTPMVAKVKRVRRRHLGITGPGLGRYPMRAGKRSTISKTFSHGVQPRLTLSERLAALRARGRIAAPRAAP